MTPSYYLIGTDGRRNGPFSPEDVRTWIADGRANRYSRVRREDDEQWLPLGDLPEFAEFTRPAAVGRAITDAPRTDGAGAGTDAGRPARLDPVSCFRRAWALVSRDFAVLGGWTLAVSLTVMSATLIPRVGWLAGLVANNLLMAGLYVLFLARMRGRRPTLESIVTIVRLTSVNLVVAGAAQIVLTVAGLLLLIVPGIYLAVGYAFVVPLVVDKQLPVWQAMELSRTTAQRHWWQVFALLLASGVMIVIASLPFGVGLVLALPLYTAALMFAYEDLFGARSQVG